MQINIVSVLESNSYSVCLSHIWEWGELAPTFKNAERTLAGDRALAALLKVKAIFSGRTAQSCVSLHPSQNVYQEDQLASAWTISFVPFAVPKYTTYWEAKSVLFFLKLRLPKIFNGTVIPKFSKKSPNMQSYRHWSPIRSCPHALSQTEWFFFSLPDTKTK